MRHRTELALVGFVLSLSACVPDGVGVTGPRRRDRVAPADAAGLDDGGAVAVAPDAGLAADAGPASTCDQLGFADLSPVLGRCTGCHDAGGEAGLDLTSYAGITRGGASGPVLTPGDCANSVVWQKTGDAPPFGDRMPRGRAPLSAAERDLICRWIEQGARATADCGGGPADCGDGVCGAGESCGSCPADCACDDTTPPVFGGIDDADGAPCVLQWTAATDDVTPSASIVYRVYRLGAGGGLTPAQETAPGATSATLSVTARTDFVVRAVDQAGNEDANLRERDCRP